MDFQHEVLRNWEDLHNWISKRKEYCPHFFPHTAPAEFKPPCMVVWCEGETGDCRPEIAYTFFDIDRLDRWASWLREFTK